MVFAQNATVTFTFDLVTSKCIGSSTDHNQSSYSVEWLSLINFSRYWANMVFALNATVTLTFDQVTSKFIGVIYWPWPIYLPSTMTVTQKLFKILSGHYVANGRTDRQTDGRTDRRTPYHYTSEVSLRAYKNQQGGTIQTGTR